jgi:hypothetical protein
MILGRGGVGWQEEGIGERVDLLFCLLHPERKGLRINHIHVHDMKSYPQMRTPFYAGKGGKLDFYVQSSGITILCILDLSRSISN